MARTLYSPFYPSPDDSGIKGTTLPATRNVSVGDWNSLPAGFQLKVGDIVQYSGSSYTVYNAHIKNLNPSVDSENFKLAASAGPTLTLRHYQTAFLFKNGMPVDPNQSISITAIRSEGVSGSINWELTPNINYSTVEDDTIEVSMPEFMGNDQVNIRAYITDGPEESLTLTRQDELSADNVSTVVEIKKDFLSENGVLLSATSDGVFSISDKKNVVIPEWLRIQSAYVLTQTAAAAVGLTVSNSPDVTNNQSAYNDLSNYLSNETDILDTDFASIVNLTEFSNYYNIYYNSEEALKKSTVALAANTSTWDGVVGPNKPQDNADVTANSQVTITPPPAQDFAADVNGIIDPISLPRVVTPAVSRGGVAIRANDATSYTLVTSNVTATISNINGSINKGQISITGVSADSGWVDIYVTVDGVGYAPVRFTVHKNRATASPPPGPSAARQHSVDVAVAINSSIYKVDSSSPVMSITPQISSVSLVASIYYERNLTQEGSSTLYGKFRYRTIGGSWIDVSAETAAETSARTVNSSSEGTGGDIKPPMYEEGYIEQYAGQLNLNQTVTLTSGVAYEFGLFLRSNSADSVSAQGTASATG